MPISNKIIKHIKALDEDDSMKKLMLDILKEEDKGVYKFKEKYISLINKYLESSGKKDLKND